MDTNKILNSGQIDLGTLMLTLLQGPWATELRLIWERTLNAAINICTKSEFIFFCHCI